MDSIEVNIIGETELRERQVNLEHQDPENHYRPRLQSLIDQYGVVPPRPSIFDRIKKSFKKFYDSLTFLYVINSILDCFPIIRCVKEYNLKKNIIGDLIAGLTVAVMHIPQGIAYGVLANLAPVYGLYVSFFPVIIYMIFGTCPHLSLGTFAIISLMTAQAIGGVPLDLTANTTINGTIVTVNLTAEEVLAAKVGISTTLAFFVGLIQLILSFLRLGFITVYLTEPFISGFTTGAAVHVFSSQIPAAFGVTNPRDIQGAFKLPRFYVRVIGSIFKEINWVTTGVCLSSIVLLLVAKYLNERYKSKIRIVLPIELVLVIFGTLISHLTKMNTKNKVSVVGPVKRGLPAPTVPPFDNISSIFISAITIAAVSLCINISLGKTFGKKHGYKVSSNQELLAYGAANVFSSFFQCFPNTASLSRTVLQESSGGKTQLAGGVSCILLLIVILALAPLIQSLPMACLAAIIIVSLKGLFYQVKDFIFYWRISLLEAALWMVTFLTIILFDVDIGLYVGVAVSFFINTLRTQKPRFAVLGRIGETEFYKNMKLFPSAQQFRHVRILRFYGSLYACNAPFFKRKFYELIGIQLRKDPLISFGKKELDEVPDNVCKYVILDCSPFNFIDTVGVKMLIEVFNDLKKRDIQMYLCECRFDVRCTLESMNFYEKTEKRLVFAAIHDAVLAIKSGLDEGSAVLTYF